MRAVVVTENVELLLMENELESACLCLYLW